MILMIRIPLQRIPTKVSLHGQRKVVGMFARVKGIQQEAVSQVLNESLFVRHHPPQSLPHVFGG